MGVAIPLLLMLLLLVAGVPVAFAFAIAGTAGLALNLGPEPALGVLQTAPYRSAASFIMTTVPMFILMAEFLANSTLARSIFRCAYRWLGHLRGGLAIATVIASGGLAALSGSSTASAATMAALAIPEMRRYGYQDRLSLGVVAAAGTFAIMIPPSIGFILYGIITETSIGRLFIAGIFPGILTVVSYCVLTVLWTYRRPDVAPPVHPFAWDVRLRSLGDVWPALLLAAVVLGGIYSGAITPTEAGAIGAFGALLIGISVGRLRGSAVIRSIDRAAGTTAMIFAIVIGATIFGYFLSATQVTQRLIGLVGSIDAPAHVILLVILLVYLILGMFMEQIAIQFITLPLVFPIIVSLGYDPVWFGIVIVKTAEIGVVTPPVGLNAYVVSGATGTPLEETFAGAAPFILADLFVLALLVLFPDIATYLPRMMR